MKVLVFAHHLELGGTQTNAIELAAAVRDHHGHEVTLFASPGPASALAGPRNLRYVEAPTVRRHPSIAMVRALREVVRREQPDLIHVWDWPQALDAYYGVSLWGSPPMLTTCMSMVVPRFFPSSTLTTFGTPELVEEGRRRTRAPAVLLEPPVDTVFNAMEAVDAGAFRQQYDLTDGPLNIVVVSRLVGELKGEGLVRAIDAVDTVAERHDVRLTIVGEGTSAEVLAEQAARVNARHKRPVVVMTGGLVDPRPAYAAADLVLGMGSSALRAMAFGKPLIILGQRGFSEIFDAATAPGFLYRGMYGLGDGNLDSAPLADQIEQLVTNPARRAEMGLFGLDLVHARYALDRTADQLETYYRAAAERRVAGWDELRSATRTTALRAGDVLVPDPLKKRLRAMATRP